MCQVKFDRVCVNGYRQRVGKARVDCLRVPRRRTLYVTWILGYLSFIVILIGWVKFTPTTDTVTNSWIAISIST